MTSFIWTMRPALILQERSYAPTADGGPTNPFPFGVIIGRVRDLLPDGGDCDDPERKTRATKDEAESPRRCRCEFVTTEMPQAL